MKSFKSIVLLVPLITASCAYAAIPAANKNINSSLPNATDFDDFIRITQLDLKVFYDNDQLQQEWFNALAKIAKKDDPSISTEQLKQKLRNNAITLLKIVRNNENMNAIPQMIGDAISIIKPIPATPQQSLLAASKINPVTGTTLEILPSLLVAEEPVMTNEELKKHLAAIEAEFYFNELQERMATMEADLYYDKTTGLITKNGIRSIIETIKSTAPIINNKDLIAATYYKAAELLKGIRKKATLGKQLSDGLVQMITDAVNQYLTTAKLQPQELGKVKVVQKQALPLEPIERRATIGAAPQPVIFTPALKELAASPETETYGYDKTPTSFSSTLQPSLPENILQFIDESKKQGINLKTMGQNWLKQAMGHILNGALLTQNNKEATLQKLFEVADAVVGVPLRFDKTITDDEYARIIGTIEQRIRSFMNNISH